jgi:hypothetical protein
MRVRANASFTSPSKKTLFNRLGFQDSILMKERSFLMGISISLAVFFVLVGLGIYAIENLMWKQR